MRHLTKKIGKLLYRDGPMLMASLLFAGLFIQQIDGVMT